MAKSAGSRFVHRSVLELIKLMTKEHGTCAPGVWSTRPIPAVEPDACGVGSQLSDAAGRLEQTEAERSNEQEMGVCFE